MRKDGDLKSKHIKSITLQWFVVGLITGLLLTYPLLALAEPDIPVEGATEVIIDVQEVIDEVATSTPELEILEPEPSPEPVNTSSHPTLKQICSCESGNGKYGTPNQFEPDGVTPLVGKLTPARLGQDIGMCQINTKYHLAAATSLGYDIYTEEGNWGYALYLYETQGTQPWEASRSCWQ